MRPITLLGTPVDCGSAQPGCLMGPDALRTAGLGTALTSLGHTVEDLGNLHPGQIAPRTHPNAALRNLDASAAWVETIAEAARSAAARSTPIFLGGDHLMSAGTLTGVAAADRRPLFVLWLDAHADFHDLGTTTSGNLHGTPVAYATGQAGFSPAFPEPLATIDPRNTCMLGLRSVDPAERARLADAQLETHDMRAIDERGILAPLTAFLHRVRAANGRLHVSLDVDFLDPTIAPAVGTTVPGGASFREAHLIMEVLSDAGLVTSLDLAELNPFLDHRGQTANLLVDLVASLFGKRILDRPTREILS